MTKRAIKQLVKGQRVSDGAGVRLTRVMGLHELPDLDPFLLLDAFHSDDPNDYIAGFPPHPHRGFETVTYLFAGNMRHQDSAGNEGVIRPGGVQWMTAGKGIIHSEMPEQENGLLHGLQLWVNLPQKDKMTAPNYQEFDKDNIPVETHDNLNIHVVSGTTDQGTAGPIQNDFVKPIYFDLDMQAGADIKQNIPRGHTAFIFVVEGEAKVHTDNDALKVGERFLAVFDDGDQVHISSDSGARLVLIAGEPLKEPMARGGPFVMNTREEVQQAFMDYQNGVLA